MRRHPRVVAMPEHDPVIEATPPELRAEVAHTWERRAHEELKVAATFSILARELLETGADPLVLAIASRGVHDEVRHAEVCRSLAARYRGGEVGWPREVIVESPPERGDRALRVAFHAVSMACVNEAIASAFLASSLEGARSPSARAAVGELLADEVEHARLGWIFLAKQPPAILRAIEANLLTLVKPVVHSWWEVGPVTLIDGAPEHGLPSVEMMRRCTVDGLRGIVLPAFEEIGVRVDPTRRWVDELGA